MISFLQFTVLLVFIYVSSHIFALAKNVVNAKRSGVPFMVLPLDQNNIPWMVMSIPLRPVFRKYLPHFIDDRLNILTYGWEFRMKLRPWKELFGYPVKSFMVAGSGRLEFNTMDPEVIVDILKRSRDFDQLDMICTIMSKFGQNVFTSNGDHWARQRKIVAGVINERISKNVFEESIRQTRGMLSTKSLRLAHDETYVDSNRMFDMIKKLVVHVLNGATMGQNDRWDDEDNEKAPPGHMLTYVESVKAIICNVTGPILIPRWILSNWPSFVPGEKNMRRLALAMKEFPELVKDMLDAERTETKAHDGATKTNIMSQLVLASEDNSKGDGGNSTQGLTDEEMTGNLFVFTAAGFDTTAGALSYALVLLARHPTWQDWLLEEVDEILPIEPYDTLDYAAVFPKATRTMAFLFETLRLYTPLVHIGRTASKAQTITTSTETIFIPAGTTCYLNTIGVHLDETIWRDLNNDTNTVTHHDHTPKHDDSDADADVDTETRDEYTFRPTRWINPPSSSSPSSPLFQPPKGYFLPWSIGPRVCPGQKMAQVEFVAILLTLLHGHTIEPVPLRMDMIGKQGEEEREREETRREMDARLDAVLSDSISVLTLQMKNVFDVDEEDAGRDGGDGGSTAEKKGRGLKLRLRRRMRMRNASDMKR